MNRTIFATIGFIVIVLLLHPNAMAALEDVGTILIQQGVVYQASGFILTREFSSKEKNRSETRLNAKEVKWKQLKPLEPLM